MSNILYSSAGIILKEQIADLTVCVHYIHDYIKVTLDYDESLYIDLDILLFY